MAYEFTLLKDELEINQIISIHYFEYMSDFSFPGESHDFWELLCVDKGEVLVEADNSFHYLRKGDIIFHKPNEFHNLKANGIIAPNLVVIAFKCDSPCMSFFKNKILPADEYERHLLAQIIVEARLAFSSRLDDPFLEKLERHSADQPSVFGSEQLIHLYLEQLLIHLIRTQGHHSQLILPAKTIKLKSGTETYNTILSYLQDHINERLSIEKICKDNLVGRSQLQKLFREKAQCGIMEYFSKIKIDAAKQLIRDNHLNFTQISDVLGYTSIHYFSRQFKKLTGMTPSEYSSSIKVLSEKPAKLSSSESH